MNSSQETHVTQADPKNAPFDGDPSLETLPIFLPFFSWGQKQRISDFLRACGYERLSVPFATFLIKTHHSVVSPSLALLAVCPVRRFLDGLRAGFFITIEVALVISEHRETRPSSHTVFLRSHSIRHFFRHSQLMGKGKLNNVNETLRRKSFF